jgi:pilus assembly protein CpaB
MQIGNLTLKPGQLYFGIALLLALGCAVLMKGSMGGGDKPTTAAKAPTKEPTTQVVVASYPVHAGDVLQPDALQIVEWPVKLLPIGQTFQDLKGLVGKPVITDIHQGEPLYKDKLAMDSTMGGLPVLIPKGLRAMTIAVSEVKGVAGFITPGSRVDVLGTFEVKESSRSKSDQLTRTVLQDVLVVATAQELQKNTLPTPEDLPEIEAKRKAASQPEGDGENDKKAADDKTAKKEEEKKPSDDEEKEAKKPEGAKIVSTITLALTPQQAEKLTLAEDTGTIRLVLRPGNDHAMVNAGGVRQSQLTGVSAVKEDTKPKQSNKRPVAVMAPAFSVELIQGTDKQAVKF